MTDQNDIEIPTGWLGQLSLCMAIINSTSNAEAVQRANHELKKMAKLADMLVKLITQTTPIDVVEDMARELCALHGVGYLTRDELYANRSAAEMLKIADALSDKFIISPRSAWTIK